MYEVVWVNRKWSWVNAIGMRYQLNCSEISWFSADTQTTIDLSSYGGILCERETSKTVFIYDTWPHHFTKFCIFHIFISFALQTDQRCSIISRLIKNFAISEKKLVSNYSKIFSTICIFWDISGCFWSRTRIRSKFSMLLMT